MVRMPEPERRRHAQPDQPSQSWPGTSVEAAPMGRAQTPAQQRQKHQKGVVLPQGDEAQKEPKPHGFVRCARNHLRVSGQPPEECGQGQQQGAVRQQQDASTQQKHRTETSQEGTQQSRALAEPALCRPGLQGEGDGIAQQGCHTQGMDRSPQPLAGPGPEPHSGGMVELAQGRMLPIKAVLGLVVARRQDGGQGQPETQPHQENQGDAQPWCEEPSTPGRQRPSHRGTSRNCAGRCRAG